MSTPDGSSEVAAANPVLLEVTRGALVESRHRGAAVVVDADGAVHARWGDVERTIFPRSAVKPLQALVLVESGAADRFDLDEAELALACSSHNGEPRHVAAVSNWLTKLGLNADALVCGGHPPLGAKAARELAAAGEKPGPLHDNCSGKHAAMLSTALALGAPIDGYQNFDHPVQQRIGATLSEMAGVEIARRDWAVDGCGVPTRAMPLVNLARAMARFAAPDELPAGRAEAARRLAAAMTAAPGMVAGEERFDSEVMAAAPGVIVKGGAEGVHVAALGGKRLAVAVKIDDGATRASDAVTAALLDRLGAFDSGQKAALGEWLEPKVRTRRGEVVGVLRPMLSGEGR